MVDTRLLQLNRDQKVFACQDLEACAIRRSQKLDAEHERRNQLNANMQ
jgi:hypothetical protein